MSDIKTYLESTLISKGDTWASEKNMEEILKKGNFPYSLLQTEVQKGTIVCHSINDKYFFTIREFHTLENKVAENVMRLLKGSVPDYSEAILDTIINLAEEKFSIRLHIEQRNAVKMAVRNPFCIITGGPGTGKTSVLKVIHFVLKQLNKCVKISFAAPTGRAASKIEESMECSASTLHSMLEITNENMKPKILNDVEVLFLDEVSMLDLQVMNSLMEAIPTGKRLIFLGDVEQLPSVGVGSILRDLINSDVVPVTMLEKTFRQKNDSTIFKNILYLKVGCAALEEGEDFNIHYSPINPTEAFIEAYLKEVKTYGIRNVVGLTPTRKKGALCSNTLNKKIQNILNKKGQQAFFEHEDGYYQINDPVMQLKNKKECANGDVGQVVSVKKDGIYVKFLKKTVFYNRRDLQQLVLAYVITIHKSQGSEYKSVVTCLFNEHRMMANRNLLYTAVTRAKQKCTLLCDKELLAEAVTKQATSRTTMLAEKIYYLFEKTKLLSA